MAEKSINNPNPVQNVATPSAESDKPDFLKKMKELVQVKPPKNEIPPKMPVEKRVEKEPEYEGQQTEKLYDIKNIAKNLTPKKVIKLVMLLALVAIVLFALYVKYIKKGPIKNDPVLIDTPKPTSGDLYQKYKPSIYADDPNFKKIDEGLLVLQNEAQNITLEEKSLLPPKLDFNITF